MKTVFKIACIILLRFAAIAGEGDDTLRYFLSKSDHAVLGAITSEPIGVMDQMGVVDYVCDFKIEASFKGSGLTNGATTQVSIVRYELGISDRNPLVKKGGECILFLKNVSPDKPALRTVDVWFGVQHPSNSMIRALKSLHVEELSVRISLGIRDTSRWTTHTDIAYPLGFRIENSGKVAIKGDDIASIFARGTIHLLPKNSKEEHRIIEDEWALQFGLVPNDLQPGETSGCKVVGNLLTFFPSIADGDYEVWWTLGDSNSNTLAFTVTNGKVSLK